jgi:hypothetical protein
MRKFPIIMRNLEKCPECLQRFHVGWQGKSSQKESIVSLHQGPKVSKAKPLNMWFDEIIELYLLCLRLQAILAAKPETSDVFNT